MQRVLIVGAGGHAQVVADLLLRSAEAGGPARPVGYLDDNAELHGRTILGLPVLGGLARCAAIPHEAVILAIGRNSLRRRLFDELLARGERFATALHPRAIVAPDAVIGQGAMICAGAVVGTGAEIGDNVIVNTAATVDHHNRIGAHSHIAPGAHLGGDVAIGEGCLVGIGAVVMPQRAVGSWSVVGAGALVHRDLPANVTAIGSPARVVRQH
jgi:sugar O-acyltransferase (sialic acid O-acetyltransferase NeuD family)